MTEPAPHAASFAIRPSVPVALWGRALSIAIPIAIWFAPLAIEPRAKHALAITLGVVIAWITQSFDLAIVGLIGCYLYWALGVVKFEVAFYGFSNSTPWFLFGALLFGVMVSKSGVARRFACFWVQR